MLISVSDLVGDLDGWSWAGSSCHAEVNGIAKSDIALTGYNHQLALADSTRQ
jgi:hypothetical protein